MIAWHPFAEKFPLLEGDEWKAFLESIKKSKGNRQPVSFRTVNGKKQGLDGRNRERACEELGLKCRYFEEIVEDDEVKEFILDANVHRRHMTAEMRREIVAELRADGKSTRAIAAAVGVTHPTILNDLKQSGGKSLPPEKVNGEDGKTYPSSQERANRLSTNHVPPPPKINEREPGDDTESEQESAQTTDPVDAEGTKIPPQALIAFERANAMQEWGRKVDELVREMKGLTEGPGARLIDYETARLHFKNGKQTVLQNRATHVCPMCDGKKMVQPCRCCNGEGWTAAHVWKRLSEERAAK